MPVSGSDMHAFACCDRPMLGSGTDPEHATIQLRWIRARRPLGQRLDRSHSCGMASRTSATLPK